MATRKPKEPEPEAFCQTEREVEEAMARADAGQRQAEAATAQAGDEAYLYSASETVERPSDDPLRLAEAAVRDAEASGHEGLTILLSGEVSP